MAESSFSTTEQPDCGSAGTWGRGRRRPDAFKAACVAETFKPGETLRSVAERRGLHYTQLSHWRSQARRGELPVPSPIEGADLSFAQVEVATSGADDHGERFEIVYGGVSLFLPGSSTTNQLVEVMRLLGAST